MLRSCTDVCLNKHPTWPPLLEAVPDSAAVRPHYSIIQTSSINHEFLHTILVTQAPLSRSGSSRRRAQATASLCLFGAAPMLVTTSRLKSTKLGSFI